MKNLNTIDMKQLIGKRVVEIRQEDMIGDKPSKLVLVMADGSEYSFWHRAVSNEEVYVESIVGDLADLIGSPLFMAHEVNNEPNTDDEKWTFYKFATIQGRVDIRWFGKHDEYAVAVHHDWTKVSEEQAEINVAKKAYDDLRTEIKNAFTTQLRRDGLLLTQQALLHEGGEPVSKKTISYLTLWRSMLTPVVRQMFNCDQCNKNWDTLFNTAVMTVEGRIVYPAVEALLKRKDDPIIKEMFVNAPAGFEDYLKGVADDATRVYYPMMEIPLEMIDNHDSYGWEHFCMIDSDDWKAYNKRFTAFNDFRYMDKLTAKLLDPEVDLDAMNDLTTWVILHTKNLPEGDQIRQQLSNVYMIHGLITKARELPTFGGIRLAYIWAAVCIKECKFLQTLDNTVAGIILNNIKLWDRHRDIDSIVRQVTTLVIRSNERDEALALAAVDMTKAREFQRNTLAGALERIGCQNALKRRALGWSEVQSKIWLPTPQTPISIVINDDSIEKGVSAEEFIALLPNVASITLTDKAQGAYQMFFTTSEIPADYSELLRFAVDVNHSAIALSPQYPRTFAGLAIDAGLVESYVRTPVMAVDGIFTRIAYDGTMMHIFQVNAIADTFSGEAAKSCGSCVIMPSVIRDQYMDLAGAITEASIAMKLGSAPSGDHVAGGLMLDTGFKFNLVMKDGTKGKYQILKK